MLKIRVMPTLLYKDKTLVKGINFNSWRRVGTLMPAIKIYNMREVDELVFLDISATREERSPDFDLVDFFADDCFMPLTVGGGVRTTDDIKHLLEVGADKVVINTAAILCPNLIKEGAEKFGSQCIVVSIDVKKSINSTYEIFTHSGTHLVGKNPLAFAKEVEDLGAGEILLTSIDRDGTMEGYDLELIKSISKAVNIPVIASGGAGNYNHMFSALSNSASAVAAASIFHFTQQTPLGAKEYLSQQGLHVRL